jgi:hypothetical protein
MAFLQPIDIMEDRVRPGFDTAVVAIDGWTEPLRRSGLSARRACTLFSVARSALRYRAAAHPIPRGRAIFLGLSLWR